MRFRTVVAVFALVLTAAATLVPGTGASGAPQQDGGLPNMNARFMADSSKSAIELGFKVGIAYVPASIRAGNMTFFYDPEHPERTSVTAMLDAGTISTGAEQTDGLLKSADWLDTENHSHIVFQSTGVGASPEGRYLEGNLTIRETTRPVRLWVDDVSDVLRDPATRLDMVHFEGHTTVSRSDFGMGTADMWNQPVIGDLPQIGDEVRIALHITGFSFNGDYLAQMFRQPLDDGSPNPVAVIYDAVNEGGVDAGIEAYEQLQAEHPGEVNHMTLSDAAWYLMLTADAGDAVEIFEKSIAEKPDEWMTYLRQGDAFVFAGLRNQAIHNYSSMREHYPTLPHIPEMLRLLGVEDSLSRR